MRYTFLLLAFLTSCTINPSVVRTKEGSYIASTGATFAAKQRLENVSIVTKEGDLITVGAADADSTKVANAVVMAYGAASLSSIASKTERAKDANSTRLGRDSIKADVSKHKINADVIKSANSNNLHLGIPSVIP